MKRVAAALTAAAAAGLGAAYGIYHLAFFQRPKLDIPTAEEWAQGSRFLPQIRENVEFVDSLPCDYVHITADDGTSLSARYSHEADDAPIAIIMHGYRATAMRDTMGLIVLCKKLGYNLLMPDQRPTGAVTATPSPWARRSATMPAPGRTGLQCGPAARCPSF